MRALYLLSKDNFLNAFRSKKAVIFLLLYVIVFGLIMYGFSHVQQEINNQFRSQGISSAQQDFMIQFAKNFLQAENQNQVMHFLLTVPFFNIALFLVTIFGTPLLILIVKYDILAQEISDKTFRFLLFRTTKWKIYIAKFISSVLEFAVITFIAFLIAVLWAKSSISDFDWERSLSAGLYFWIISQVFLAVFMAFNMLISVMVKKPFQALLLSCLGLFTFTILPVWFDYLSPFNMVYLNGLFYGFSRELFLSLASYFIFIFLFLGLGFVIFNRKNL